MVKLLLETELLLVATVDHLMVYDGKVKFHPDASLTSLLLNDFRKRNLSVASQLPHSPPNLLTDPTPPFIAAP